MKTKKVKRRFSTGEILLWSISSAGIVLAYALFDGSNPLALAASLIGVTSLIFTAKGNPAGQALMIVFSLLYGYISYTFSYWGEMITYLGMTLPMAILALISWLRHPYRGDRSQVAVNALGRRETVLMWILTGAVTALFGWLLSCLHTPNLLPGTISVSTSFLAAYLTFRRSALFALAYAANDLILIVLWSLASVRDRGYLSVAVCFVAFFAGDLYGFINWRRLRRRQQA